MDSVVVSRGGERERESLCSFVSSRDTQTKREACCVSQPSSYLSSFHLLCVGVGVVKATFRERHFLFFSFLFFFVSPSFVFFFFFDNNA